MANAKFVKTAAAVALGASVVTTAVAPGAASAATTYKIKDGKLYKNGKIAKGYVVYKGKLYKNGKLNKGYAKVGTGSKMKLYFNSSLKKGFKTANNATLLFKDGVLFKGYKQAGSNERLYKDGKLTTGWEVYTDAEGVKFLYSKGYLYKNLKTAKRGGVTNLFENGKLAEGTKAFQNTLFTDGTVDEKDQVFEDVLYVGGKKAEGTVTFEDVVYIDGVKDAEKPEITAEDKTVAYGSEAVDVATLATVKDNSGEEIKAEAKISFDGKAVEKIDTKTPGVYTVTFTAKDKNGNEATKEVKVTVAEAVKAEVESVKAINATQLKVTFNKTVDADAAKVLTNYSVAGTNPTSAVVADDAKSVVVTFAAASTLKGSDKTVTVLPITLASDNEKSTAKFVTLLTYVDEVNPEIAEVTSTTAGTVANAVTVKASEPIANATAKIDGVNYAINFNNTDTATITGLQLDATKSHTLELLNVTDLEGNKTISTSKTFNVVVDKNAPTVALSAQGDNTVVLEFNKDMDVNSVEAAFAANSGNVKDETLGTVNHKVVTQIDNSKKKFAVQLNDATLYDNKTSRTLTLVLPATLKDELGNTVAATTKQVTLSKDTVAPAYTSYKIKKNANGEVTDVEFNFSEELAAKAAASITPTVVKSNGEAVSLANILGGLSNAAVTVNDKKVVFTATTPAKITGKYTFSFAKGSVTDTAVKGNDSAAFSTTVDFGEAAATELTLPAGAVSKVSGSKGKYEVNFGTAVKGGAVAGSATDASNYTLAGKALPEGTTIVLKEGSDQKVAVITLPAGSVAKDDANALFTVANVQTVAGNTFKLYTQTIAVEDTVAPVLKSAALTSDNKLAVDFGEVLNVTPATTDLVIKINGKTLTTTPAIAVGTGSDAAKYLIDLSSLLVNGTDAVTGASATPATPSYLDLDGSNDFDATKDVKIADGAITGFKLSTSSVITSVTVSTKGSGTLTGADANGNTLTNGTTVTAK